MIFGHQKDLADDLAGGQVALDSEERCEAELAINRASDLSGDANRVPARFWHQNSLDCASIFQAKQVPPGAVARIERVGDLRYTEIVLLGQPAAQVHG